MTRDEYLLNELQALQKRSGEAVAQARAELAAAQQKVSDLTAENETLTTENRTLKAQVQALSDRGEFVEDCIAEMAEVVYAEG